MTAGTTALLMLVGGGTAGVVAWAHDSPAIVTAGPDELAEPVVPGGIGDAVAPEEPPAGDDADQPWSPPRGPGITREMRDGLATGVTPAAVAPKGTKAPKTEAPTLKAPIPKASIPKAPAINTTSTKTPTTKDPGTKAAGETSTVPSPHRTTQPPVPTSARPVITTRTEVETHAIPFRTRVVRDPALPRGTKDVQAEGETGVRSLRYLITLTDGKRTDRRFLDATVTKRPEPRLIAIGVGRDRDQDTDDDNPWDCGPGGSGDLCLPFGRSSATCVESDDSDDSDEHDSGGSGAGMIVLGESVIDDEDIGLPDGYNWAC